MLALVERAVMFVARVPEAPAAPAGLPESVRVFRAAPAYFRYRLLAWCLRLPLAVAGLLFGIYWFDRAVLQHVGGAVRIAFGVVELLGIVGFATQTLVSFLSLRLDYRLRHYAVTDRSLRVREGVWQVREMTMTFANVQNIELHQGPLQRWFGIADLRVQSAGGGGGGEGRHARHESGVIDPHSAWFRGIADAPAVRELVLARLRRLRDAGLGDIDEAPGHAEPRPDPREADLAGGDLLRALRDEAAGLRQAAVALTRGRDGSCGGRAAGVRT